MSEDIPDIQPISNSSDAEQAVLGRVQGNGRATNFASIDRVRDRIQNEIIPLVNEIRDGRQGLNDWWTKLFHVWTMEHDDQGYRSPTSNIYMPAGRKGAETIVSQLVSGTFPGDDNFGVAARQEIGAMDDAAMRLKRVLRHRIDSTAKVRVAADRFYRQLVTTGNSPVKTYYHRHLIRGKGRSRNPMQAFEERTRVLFDSPVFKTIDCANFYMWPESVDDPRDAQIIFEDLTTTYANAMARARDGVYDMDQVKKGGANAGQSSRQTAERNKLSAQMLYGRSKETGIGGWGALDITEIWLDFDPDAKCKEDEKNPEPFLITVTASGEVLRAIPNPFWHKRPPFLVGRMGLTVGRVYGTGFVEAIRELNRLLNDQTNQSMDAANYVLNPIVQTNPNYVHGRLAKLAPGVQWLVSDIEKAVKFDRPPVEMIQAGSILMTQTQAWMSDFMGTPPVLTGGSSPGRAYKTATGIGTAQANARLPLQEIIRLCEAEVWREMLFMFHSLDEQFAEEAWMLPSDGRKEMLRVRPEEIAGDWNFEWLASTQTANQALKGSQIMEAVSLLSNPKIVELLQANKVQVNPEPMIRKLFQEILGIRNVDEVLIKSAMEGMQQAPGVVPEIGQPPMPPPDAPMNLPDETQNPEFLGMREGADDLSAMLGGLPLAGGLQAA